MGMFGRGGDGAVVTAFVAKDEMTPVVRGIRATMDRFKKDASTGFGLAAGISVFSAATKAVDFLGDSLSAYTSDQASVAKLTQAIEANSTAWDGNTKAVEDVIASRTRLGFADDDQRDSLAQLVAQVQDLDAALRIQRTAMDLARLKSMSLTDAGNVLAKAYNGSTTALNKMGIKLKAGTRGLEAIDAVQSRVAGQAQAYAETLAGSAEVMALSFDEFKESVGGALSDALQPFFKLVVDLTNQTPDLDTSLGKLTQSYRDQIEAAKFSAQTTEQGGTIFDDVGKRIYAMVSAQDAAIHDFTGTLGDYSRILGVTRHDLALFTEAGLTAGQSLEDIRASLDALIKQHVEEKAKSIGHAWQTGMDGLSSAVDGAVISLHTLPPETTHAVVGMKRAIKDGKAGIVEQFRQLAWQSKHPFATVNYEAWLERKQAKAVRLMKQAAKDGRPDVVEQYRQMVQDIHDELDGLPGYAAGIGDSAMAQLAGIGPAVTNIMNGGLGGVSVDDPVKPRRRNKRNKRNRAMGGPTEAGGTYVVGENGPELLQMGSQRGNVTATHRLGGGVTNVYIDGRKLFEIMDGRQGRAIAMGG